MSDLEITILRATSSEIELARQALREITLATSHHRPPLDDAALAEFLANPRHYFLLAAEREKVVGSLYGYALQHPYRREPQFFLYGIDVRPECRNRKIGTALVDQFINEARLAGAFEVWVLTNESNRAAMSMYAHAGLTRPNPDDAMLNLTLSVTT
jgi:ribosomal protein S18 acetylase RimI-like enzyme